MQLVLIVVVFALLSVPVRRLTREAEAAPASATGLAGEGVQAPASASTAAGPVTLTVGADFAPAPTEFSVSYLGDTILQGQGQASASGPWKVALPAEGADLVLHAAWPTGGGGSGAARVTVRSPDGKTVERNFWSPGAANLDTVLTVPGSGR